MLVDGVAPPSGHDARISGRIPGEGSAHVSSIVDELEEFESSRSPTLRLVDHKYSGLVLACLALSFGAQTTRVPAARLHAQVDAYLEELDEAGYETPPNATGRSLCLSWVRESWLSRVPDEEGEEAYERTSSALNAERVVSTLRRTAPMVSESRLRTIVDVAHRWAQEAQPDVESRIEDLDAEIARLSRERDRLAAGGDLPRADEERMRLGYADMVDLLEQLPGDFRRVEESLEEIQARMIHDFRTEERPQGEVLGSYLDAAENLMTATPAGRAFSGALGILADEDSLEAFRADLRAIMDHPFAQELEPRRRRDFMDAVGVLRRGLHGVQTRQLQASRALAEYLTHAEPERDQELSTALHRVQSELSVFSQNAGVHARIPMSSVPSRPELGHLRRRVDALTPPTPAAPLQDVSRSAPGAPQLDEVLRYGGPLVEQVAAALAQQDPQRNRTVPEAFNTLPDALRRPVELFGLMQMAAERGLLGPDAADAAEAGGAERTSVGTNTVHTVRPDGTTRELSMPALLFSSELFRVPDETVPEHPAAPAANNES